MLDQDRRASLRRQEINLSHGAEWNALISKYIGTIPLSSDVCVAAEHNISCAPLPKMPVRAAMNAKLGVAASDSQWSGLAVSRS